MNSSSTETQLSTTYSMRTISFWCPTCQRKINIFTSNNIPTVNCGTCNSVCPQITQSQIPHNRQNQEFLNEHSNNPNLTNNFYTFFFFPIFSFATHMHMGNPTPHEPEGLSKEQIQAIPRVKFGKGLNLLSEECSVCQESFNEGEEVLNLKCQHLFHEECIGKWLSNKRNCPVCRQTCN